MGYYIFKEKAGRSEASEFKQAAKMAKEGIEIMCELVEQMEDEFGERYGERGNYGGRGNYGRRDRERERDRNVYDPEDGWMREGGYGERRSRSTGRYM